AVFLVTCVLVNPLRETAIQDDWAYALTVRHLLETGEYKLHDWAAANMPFQAYWGGLFARVFGFSHGVLRVSTLAALFLGVVGFFFLAREHGFSPRGAGLLGLGLLTSPLVVHLGFSFMTDVPFLAWLVIALWLYTRALRLGSYGAMAAAAVAA